MNTPTLRTMLALVPVGLAAAMTSIDPYSIAAGIFAGLLAAAGPMAGRAPAGGLAVGLLGGPAFELPGSWFALLVATMLGEGRGRVSVLPAALGLSVSVTWGCDPGLWPVWLALSVLAVVGCAPWDEGLLSVMFVCAGLGGLRTARVLQVVDEAPAEELPLILEQYGAAWGASTVEAELIRDGWIHVGDRRRDRGRRIAELGGGRLAFRALGTEPLPTWERAALLNQCGRVLPARVLGFLEPPADAAVGPGLVWERDGWRESEHVVVPVVLGASVSELVVRAEGTFFLGWPELTVQVAGTRLGPVTVPEEGEAWVVPVALPSGVHRLTATFENAYAGRGSRRAITHVEVELR